MESESEQHATLLEKVRDLLKAPDVPSALTIYKATGLAPNQLWAIKTGKTKEPGVNKIQTLYEYLSGKQLPL